MKLTIEIDGLATQVIEAEQYILISDKGSSHSGAFEWLLSELTIKTHQIVDQLKEKNVNTPTV